MMEPDDMEGTSVGHWHSMDGSPLWLGDWTQSLGPQKGELDPRSIIGNWMILSERGSRKRICKRRGKKHVYLDLGFGKEKFFLLTLNHKFTLIQLWAGVHFFFFFWWQIPTVLYMRTLFKMSPVWWFSPESGKCKYKSFLEECHSNPGF